MELDVGTFKRGGVTDRVLVSEQRGPQGLDLRRCRVPSRLTGQSGLEEDARRLEVAHTFVRGYGHADRS